MNPGKESVRVCVVLLAYPMVLSAQTRWVAPKLQAGGSVPSAVYGAIRVNPSMTVGAAPSWALPSGNFLPKAVPTAGSLPGIQAAAPAVGEAAAPDALGPVSVAPAPTEGAAATLEQLHDMAALLAARAGKTETADPGRAFDGKEKLEDLMEGPEAVEAETVTREVAEPGVETMDLWMTGKGIRKPVVKSQIYGTMRTIRGKPSLRYWRKFAKGVPVRVLLGNSTLFVSRVEDSRVKKVKALTKKDLEGILPAATFKTKSIAQIRRAVMADLRSREARAAAYSGKAGAVITPETEVSLVRFVPYGEAASLPENSDGASADPRVRRPVAVPEALSNTHLFLPKVVFLDLRGVAGPLSYDVIEDIGKLMKAGVYFVLLSEKPVQGPGSIEEQLTGALTAKQRDLVTRYKLFSLGLDGNEFAKYEGRFPKTLAFTRFEWRDIDIMKHVAASLGGAVIQSFAKEVIVGLPKGADIDAFGREFAAQLKSFSVPASGYAMTPGRIRGKPALVLRPHSLETAFPVLLEALREDENLYVNESDIMMVSRDAAILQVLPGAVKPAEHAPGESAEGLLETTLAAMLGPYRENRPGDFAASASKIGAFKKGYLASGGDGGNVYMFMGHVIHSAFNWVVWAYRNTGVLPDAEALAAKALEIWAKEDSERAKNLLTQSSQSMADHQATMELRVRAMHAIVADVVKKYPIVIGTELPNLHVFERIKKGRLAARDILRMVYDLVVARETPDGLELVVVDFKTGQTKTNQTFDKDVQVQLYDLVPRLAWQAIPVPYRVGGAMKKVSKVGVLFVYASESKEARLTEWTRIKYEKYLRSIMNRMRRASQPQPK
ncbi:MAG: PD-(D/E)XK nuclease family protein [Elusimicrobia bacterium]|nr:PD-(D/E)XK nuclease family protein [Elusimicrobiota bacterium]